MSINSELLVVFNNKIQCTLSLNDGSFPYTKAIITELTNDYLTFTSPVISGDKESLIKYTFKTSCVEGVGYIIASLDLPEEEKDIDLDDYDIEIL